MMDLYREEVLDHYRNPRNVGRLAGADVRARESNASCGDMIDIGLKLGNSGGRRGVARKPSVADVKFRSIGCVLSTAAASMLTEWMEGRTLAEVEAFGEEDMLQFFGGSITPTRLRCVLLPLRALRRALEQIKE